MHKTRVARIALALCLVLFAGSIFGISRVTFKGEFIAIMEKPEITNEADVYETLSQWQDPPLSLLATWQGSSLEGSGDALSDVVFELNFENGVEQVVSPFSLTLADSRSNPLEVAMESGENIGAALKAVRDETLFGSSLLSADLRTSLLHVQGGDHVALADRYSTCSPTEELCIRPIGSKTIELVIQERLDAENAYFPIISASLSILVLFVWFGKLQRAFFLMIPPVVGCIWFVGAMGLLGVPFDPFNAIIPTVVMTLGVADMLHLQRARDLSACHAKMDLSALLAVLPAISITTVTTAIAFASLYLEGSVVLQRLAISGVLGILILWLAVVMLGPFCINTRQGASALQSKLNGPFLQYIQTLRFRFTKQGRVMTAGLVLFGAIIALNTPSDFTFHENIPEGETSRAFDQASSQGLMLAPIFFEWAPDNQSDVSKKIIDIYAASHPISPQQIDELATPNGNYILPYPIRFGTSARQIEQVVEEVQSVLMPAGAVKASGYPLNAATTILATITNLQFILFACFALHAIVIGLVMRSLRIACITIVPNVLPVFAIYLFMVLLVGWIDVAAAVAMILISGIAVDDTTHLLWASRNNGHANGVSIDRGLKTSFEPILLTTLVLGVGFAPLLVSQLHLVHTLAGLMIIALIVAWLADVILLPMLFKRQM